MIIDVHHHYLPKRFFDDQRLLPADMEAVWENGKVFYRYRESKRTVVPPMDPTWWHDEDKQLHAMDEAGVDHAVVSVACYQDWMTIEAARVINDETAAMVARHPDRFSGMASVPPDGGDAMTEELKRARELGLCAVNITTAHRGRYPDHPDFRRLFETAAQLHLPVYVHPSWVTPLPGMERWDLDRAIGKPTDLTLAIANLMFAGHFQDLPQLRVLFAHLGGSFPITMRRLFHGPKGWLRVPDYDYAALLKRLYIDTGPGMWWSPAEIEASADIVGATQMLLGSDYPLSQDPVGLLKKAVHNVLGTGLPQDDKAWIAGGNAIKLFGLKHLPEGAKLIGHRHVPGTGCC